MVSWWNAFEISFSTSMSDISISSFGLKVQNMRFHQLKSGAMHLFLGVIICISVIPCYNPCLSRHRQTHRSPEDSKARKCPECNKVKTGGGKVKEKEKEKEKVKEKDKD